MLLRRTTMNKQSENNINTLSLSLRIRILREYDSKSPKPKISHLANKYNISFAQMKHLLLNRDSILNSHEDELERMREEKIVFLGKVMFEYIQRIVKHNITVDDETVLQKAIEVEESIDVDNFKPTLLWLNDFKKAYGIPSFETEVLRAKILPLMESKKHKLSAFDLIAHVGGLETKAKSLQLGKKDNKCVPQINRQPLPKSFEDELARKRQEKIVFLEKVMYEYIQRVAQHRVMVNDEIVLQKAIEVKECIDVDNFEPTLLWLNDFKKTYGISSFETEMLRTSILPLMDSKKPQLTAFDLIAHVGNHCLRKRAKNRKTLPRTSPAPPTTDDIEVKPPIIDIECDSPVNSIHESESNKCHLTTSECEIKSLEDALKHLRLLEEYAMLQDNFRAIGLLTHLEDVLRNPQENEII